jgi:hypothetical protein
MRRPAHGSRRFRCGCRSEQARSSCPAQAEQLGVPRRHEDPEAEEGLGGDEQGDQVLVGFGDGVRRAGQQEFEDAEVNLLAGASALFARAVRRGLVAEVCRSPVALADAPGFVELDEAGEPIRTSSSAEPLVAEISGTTAEAGLRSPAIHAIASATRTAIAAVGAAPALPSSTVKKPAGTWLVLHGGLVGTAGSGRVAVFIQRAHPTLVAPLLLKAYGLTPREQEVAQLVLRGATAIQAAQRFAILPPPSTIT